MGFIEILMIVGAPVTILGIFLRGYGIINNKTFKKESILTRESIGEMIREESRLTRESIGEMIKETTKYLGDLIVAVGDNRR